MSGSVLYHPSRARHMPVTVQSNIVEESQRQTFILAVPVTRRASNGPVLIKDMFTGADIARDMTGNRRCELVTVQSRFSLRIYC